MTFVPSCLRHSSVLIPVSSHRLMHWAREYIVSMAPGSGLGGEGHLSPPPPKPHEVLMAAWEYTIGEKASGRERETEGGCIVRGREGRGVLCWQERLLIVVAV